MLVKWLLEETFTVLQTNNVILGIDKRPVVGRVYMVQYENAKYEAMIMKLGSKLECEKQLNTVCQYNMDQVDKLKKRKFTKSDLNVSEIADSDMVDDLKLIIKERDVYIEQLTTQVINLKKQIVEKNLEFDNLSKSISVCDKQKFINLSKTILNGFATSQDVFDLAVRSSSNDDNKMVI